jgi:hypothetical protein
MKWILLVACATGIIITACTKRSSTDPVNDPIDTTTMAIVLYQGNFSNGPYGSTSGQARVYEQNGNWQLRLENFRVSNGPDLKVYLSKEEQPLNFISLGGLKSTSGNQTYTISGMPNLMEFKYALIHCEQFNHLFGVSLLVKQ